MISIIKEIEIQRAYYFGRNGEAPTHIVIPFAWKNRLWDELQETATGIVSSYEWTNDEFRGLKILWCVNTDKILILHLK